MPARPATLPAWPAAMTEQLAAAYCGISVDTFDKVCPVKPVVITQSRRGRRYLKCRLDEWLLSLEDRPQRPRGGSMGALWDAEGETERA